MKQEKLPDRAFVGIDLSAARSNLRLLRRHAPAARLICTVKANAYGHGAVRLSDLYAEAGADMLAVATAAEASELRRAGISLPILVLGYTTPADAVALAREGVRICLFSREQACAVSAAAAAAGVAVTVHIKIDSGMGRLGFAYTAEREILACTALPQLVFEGIFTHFAAADTGGEGSAFTALQHRRFATLLARLAASGLFFRLRHAANSAALLAHPETHQNAVRAGIALYGLSPFPDRRIPALTPILHLFAPIVHIFPLARGESVGYGRTYHAESARRIAVLPLGYADGIPRLAAEAGLSARIGTRFCRFVGRVCMDMAMLDITDAPAASLGALAEIYGGRGETAVETVAARTKRIPYEVTCALGARLPRVYFEGKFPAHS